MIDTSRVRRGEDMLNVVLANSKKEIIDNFLVRGRVFIVEQAIDYEIEFDGLDSDCDLFVCYKDDIPVGAARLYKNKIGRVATLKAYRNQGIAKALMSFIEAHAKTIGLNELVLHAQYYVLNVYLSCGYQPVGEIFQEADIDHIKMIKRL